jgi:SAM-dependent methyltransferase
VKIDFPWPSLPSCAEKPFWTGHGFKVGSGIEPVLAYGGEKSGWSDELTAFHEKTAGGNHFIDVASRRHALDQTKKHIQNISPVILEIGCSSGFMLRLLRKQFPNALTIGSDYVIGALLRLAREIPDLPLLQFDLTTCPLPDDHLDAVILLNVLEHIPDDAAAIAQVFRILRPGGIAVIEVPAGPALFDYYDQLLMHHRRYSFTMLNHLVQRTNFRVINRSHLGFFLYPGFWIVKQRNRRSTLPNHTNIRKAVDRNIRDSGRSGLFKIFMQFELFLGRWISYPFGIRCLLTLQKPF